MHVAHIDSVLTSEELSEKKQHNKNNNSKSKTMMPYFVCDHNAGDNYWETISEAPTWMDVNFLSWHNPFSNYFGRRLVLILFASILWSGLMNDVRLIFSYTP